jgi:AraC-like DNA-binding protein
MVNTHTDTVIPIYPFEPDKASGNTYFRIQRNDRVAYNRYADFLIPHRKGYYFMAFVREGSSRHWIDTTPYILQPNSFYFTTPHQVHLKEEPRPMTGYALSFAEEFLALDDSGFLKGLPIIENPHNGHELRLSEADQVFIEDILDKLLLEYGAGNPWQNNMLVAYMRVLLIYLSRLYTEQCSRYASAPDRVLLRRFLSAVSASYAQLHEVSAYAELLNISAGYLSEVIKEQSGRPAIAHIHERLVVEARRLLFHTDLAVKEIAFELGFEDASYFNRFFKRLTQQTPVEYRTHIREMYH